MDTPKIYFGAGLFSTEHGYKSAEDLKPWFDTLLESQRIFPISGIDSAVAYRECEEWMGQINVGSHYGFPIATKLTGGAHPALIATKANVITQARESSSRIGVEQFDILFLHAPDPRVSVEETLSGFDALHKQGLFKRFGIANHTAKEVEELVQVCKEKNFILPSVFQGSYNPIARLPEDDLLPILRKHNISFVAYSPLAGGFLAKKSQEFENEGRNLQGRWSKDGFLGKVYQFLYNKPLPLAALDKWHEIAAADGITSSEMAYRWVAYNSALTKDDGMLVGATTIDQWKSNVAAIRKGPLNSETAAKIDALWTPELKAEGILDNFAAIKGVKLSAM